MGLAEFGGRGHSWALQGSCLPLIPSVWGRNGPPAPRGRFVLAEDLTQPLAQSSLSALPSLSIKRQPDLAPGLLLPACLLLSFPCPFLFTQHTVPFVCLFLSHSVCPSRTGCPANIWRPEPWPLSCDGLSEFWGAWPALCLTFSSQDLFPIETWRGQQCAFL